MPSNAQSAESRQKQSDASKKDTLALMKGKKKRTLEFSIYLTDEDGVDQELKLKYQAIGSVEYDKLVSKHPPKAEDRVEGASFNLDSFAPALIAKVCIDPEMSDEDAKEIWNSPDWSRGDLMVLFRNAVDLNNQGLDIPFNATA